MGRYRWMGTHTFVLAAIVGWVGGVVRADTFIYRDEAGKRVEVEARVVGSGHGFGALARADGQYRVVSARAVEKRERAEGPEPMEPEAIAAALAKEFGAERFRSSIQMPFVMGLVLAGPLPRGGEPRATNFLQQVAAFMKNVDAAFTRFLKEARISAKPSKFPLVVLIFESRADFEKYVEPTLMGSEVSTKHIGGFYSRLTNYLAVRLDECRTYDVVLHEAIHQQTYNRNMIQRLAPIPAWFDEGIATGFEANQGKINVGPGKISLRYAEQALSSEDVSWKQMAVDDAVFAKADLVSAAYGNAWGLHWLLFTRYKSQYGEYLRRLAQKKPLEKDSPNDRLDDLREAVDKSPDALQKEFLPLLKAGMKRQKVSAATKNPPGYFLATRNLGEVKAYVVQRQDRLEAHGTLTNTSPLRPMTFHVTVEHGSGTTIEWLIPNLGIMKTQPLPAQGQPLPMMLGGGAVPRTFRVLVESAPPDSQQALQWQHGGGTVKKTER